MPGERRMLCLGGCNPCCNLCLASAHTLVGLGSCSRAEQRTWGSRCLGGGYVGIEGGSWAQSPARMLLGQHRAQPSTSVLGQL